MKTLLAIVALCAMAIGCGDGSGGADPTSVCEHQNALCDGIDEPNDCSTSQAVYNASTGEQKAFLDKVLPCTKQATTCDEVKTCYLNALSGGLEQTD